MMPENNTDKTPKATMISRHKYWVLALVAIVVLGAFLAIRSNNNRVPSNGVSSGTVQVNQAKVSLGSSGFNPETIIVKPRTQVTWTNTDTNPHKVAAGPYPADNSIPGFDSTQLLQKGDSYSFTFDKAGTYHVHDQLNPLKYNATVEVK